MLSPAPPSGRFDGAVHLFPLRVYFDDTDLAGVVYHANYLRWFDRARSDMLRLLGIGQRVEHDAGEGAYAVTELSIRYAAPARLDDVVVVRSEIAELGRASCRLAQSAWCGDTLLAAARIRVAFLTPAGRPRGQPKTWFDAIKTIHDPRPDNRIPTVS